ncbi:MAG: hypothetical protein F6K63_05690 [Moorea sp. SIO1G6]|uniref:hypothetical protein n=1 Tax=Moorena sp. SIO1G6 TaxID=2607840 RepID=UPI0013BFEE4E|nr:hypothetical protein [Moorena sp. SIO1G6]NET63926.1 hypothetical protein [Moorena sp. SIO1G6]
MSQDVITKEKSTERLNPPLPIQPWSVDAEADRLMDDLFGDLYQMIENGCELPTEPPEPDYVSLEPIAIPKIPIPGAIIPFLESPLPSTQELAETTSSELETTTADTNSSTVADHSGQFLDKLLWALALLSLSAITMMWLTSQGKLTWSWLNNLVALGSVQQGKVSEPDAQFINYMLRSLEVIDRKAKAIKKPVIAQSLPNPTPPNRPVAHNSAPTAPPTAVKERVLERVYYIPIEKVPTPDPAIASSAPSAPVKPSPPTTPKITPKPSPIPKPPSNAVLEPPPPTILELPPPPIPDPLPTATLDRLPPPPPPPPSSPAIKHTLVGLLELGEQSAALFKIDGVTQRVKLGEAIANSGWTLVSVDNQEAVIRRNGEVRSIYVGQHF